MMTDTGPGSPEQPTHRQGGDEARCAHCHARLAPGIAWCAQCYTPIASAEPEPEAGTEPGTGTEHVAGREPLAGTEEPTSRSDHGDGRAGHLAGAEPDARTAAEADRMLAGLAATSRSGRRGGAGFTAALSNTGVRVAVVAVGLVLLSALGLGLLGLLGLLL